MESQNIEEEKLVKVVLIGATGSGKSRTWPKYQNLCPNLKTLQIHPEFVIFCSDLQLVDGSSRWDF